LGGNRQEEITSNIHLQFIELHMNPRQAALINSIVLLIVGFWGYAANNFATHTAIVPLGAGLFMLVLSWFLNKENKTLLLFMMLFTLTLFIAFMVPFRRNAEQSDYMGMLRLGIEMIACAMAFIVYLRSLKQNKKTASL
jgi:hypothetical protein